MSDRLPDKPQDRALGRALLAELLGAQLRVIVALVALAMLPCGTASAWEIKKETSPVDDSLSVWLTRKSNEALKAAEAAQEFKGLGDIEGLEGLEAMRKLYLNHSGNFPSLTIRCWEGATSVYIAYGRYIGSKNVSLITRFDKQPAERATWRSSTGDTGAGLWNASQAIPFIQELTYWDKLFVRVQPPRDEPIDATFAIEGLDEKIDQLGDACGWTLPRETAEEKREKIIAAQMMLNDLGYEAGPPDGRMTTETRVAVETYQEAAGLEVTGDLDRATLIALEPIPGAPPGEKVKVDSPRFEVPYQDSFVLRRPTHATGTTEPSEQERLETD